MSAGLAADGAVEGGRGPRGRARQGRQRPTAERGREEGSRPFLGNISALGKAALPPSVAAAAAMGIGVGAERRRERKREKEEPLTHYAKYEGRIEAPGLVCLK